MSVESVELAASRSVEDAAQADPHTNGNSHHSNVPNGNAVQAVAPAPVPPVPDFPVSDLLGYGYNVFFGRYANPDSKMLQIFDATKVAIAGYKTQTANGKTYKLPVFVEASGNTNSAIDVQFGTTIDEYQHNIAGSVNINGSYNAFSGSISSRFTSTVTKSAKHVFSNVRDRTTQWSLVFNPTAEFRNYAKNDFLIQLDAAAAGTDAQKDTFFQTWGTHFISGVLTGGIISYASATDETKYTGSLSVSAVAQASYKAVSGQLDANGMIEYKNAIASFQLASEQESQVRGGSSLYAGELTKVLMTNGDATAARTRWLTSIQDTPTLIDFPTDNSLSPMWIMCKSDGESDKMRAYYQNSYAKRASLMAAMGKGYLAGLQVVTSKNSITTPPPGYNLVAYDLNAGAKGDFVYLCKSILIADHANPPKTCIIDLRVIYGKNTPTPNGFKKINVDLNSGAGGKFVYLCYQEVPYNPQSSQSAILDIAVVGGTTPFPPMPAGYTQVEGDLNAGAGGRYIYFCYKNG